MADLAPCYRLLLCLRATRLELITIMAAINDFESVGDVVGGQ